MIFVDTSVLYPAANHTHQSHRAAVRCFLSARVETHATAAHCMAELYNKLTGIKAPRLIPPLIASQTVEAFGARFSLVALLPEETLETIKKASQQGLGGGIVYDTLILACARKVSASAILTYNTSHFHRIAPDLADIIRQP